jgi:hypothetical protein
LADEFRAISAKIEYEDAEGTEIIAELAEFVRSITTKLVVHHKQNIGTSEEALDLGGLATLGYALFKNLDDTNYCELRSGTGAGNDIIRLDPLGGAMFRFGSDITAPFAIAITAAVQIEYWIWAV